MRVDDAIETALLDVVGPGAIEAAVTAQATINEQRDQIREALARDLQAARYEADRAFRQYNAADPENRLVTGELERRWSAALTAAAAIEQRIVDHDAARGQEPACEPLSLLELANDLKFIWQAPATDVRLKKRIVRTLVQEVVADLDTETAEIVLAIHWAGGIHTELRLPRRRRGQRNSTGADIIAVVRDLVRIANDDLIASLLNRNGLRTGNGNRWTRERGTVRNFVCEALFTLLIRRWRVRSVHRREWRTGPLPWTIPSGA